MFSIKIIVNPKAGGGRALKALQRAQEVLRAAGWNLDVVLTQRPNHATEIARKAADQKVPLIAVIGGDGTINEVIQGIVGTETRLAIIPGGTGNDHARSLNIPLHPGKAAAMIAQGKVLTMDIGKERDRDFGCLVAMGFPVDVIDHTNKKHRLLGGSLAILSSVWQTLKDLHFYEAHVTLDDASFSVTTCGIFVLNTPSVGGGFRFSPKADITDGLLDIMIVGPVTTWDLLSTLPKAYKGKHLGHPAIRLHRARKVRIETAELLPKMFDGEVLGTTPIEVIVRPKALRMVVPADFPGTGPMLISDLGQKETSSPVELAKVGL
ncbi:MAG: diacylglycerol kinase family lipid kinase [Firmicutes bacterium]|nr:diacylglycerol kinase family lipid kinase [Bacillota bacterium]